MGATGVVLLSGKKITIGQQLDNGFQPCNNIRTTEKALEVN